ncbi:hypothetical protein SOVF_165480, partial [Spinacia oleracea]
ITACSETMRFSSCWNPYCPDCQVIVYALLI